jgi:hypothetical protein
MFNVRRRLYRENPYKTAAKKKTKPFIKIILTKRMLDPQKKIGRISREKYFTSESSSLRQKIVVKIIKIVESRNKIVKKLGRERVIKKITLSKAAQAANFSLLPNLL